MKCDIPIEPAALSIEQACAFTGLGKTKFYELIGLRALKRVGWDGGAWSCAATCKNFSKR